MCVCMEALKHKYILFCSTVYNTSRGQSFMKTEDRSGAGVGGVSESVEPISESVSCSAVFDYLPPHGL